jgi:hypothetical protein
MWKRAPSADLVGTGREPGAPSLDPVPQELSATIEARFTATGVSLPAPDTLAGR